MQTATKYRYSFDRSSKKYNCPQCRQKRFTRTIDNETRDLLPDHVGRCDRENQCGYNYTWSQYLKETGEERKPFIDNTPPEPVKPVEFIPLQYVEDSIIHPKTGKRLQEKNNFFLYLKSMFSEPVADEIFKKYVIGTSGHWRGATIFWQIDSLGNARQAKIMLYDPQTGKRVKAGAEVERFDRVSKTYVKEVTEQSCSKIQGKYLPGISKEINLEQCFFGEHLLTEYPEAEVLIFESEKTALIVSAYLPSFICLATGGASGCRWREYATYSILKDRSVTFFPDYGYFNKKTEKTCYGEWTERVARIQEVLSGKFRVSDVLERRLSDQERKDEDLADLLLIRDEDTGIALTEHGYPLIFDYKINAA